MSATVYLLKWCPFNEELLIHAIGWTLKGDSKKVLTLLNTLFTDLVLFLMVST